MAIWSAAAAAVALGAVLAVFVHPAVAVVAALGAVIAPAMLASLRMALIALVAVITLLPFAALPLGIGFNPTLLDFALGALYLIWVMRIVTRRDSLLPLPQGIIPVAALIGVMAVAFLAGLSHATPTKTEIRGFAELLLGCGLFVVLWTLIRDRLQLTFLFRVIVVLGALSAVIGLGLYVLPDATEMRLLSMLRVVDYPTGPGVVRYLNDDPSRLPRATGTSIDPNSFGGMLAVLAALLAPQVVSRRPLLPRPMAAALLAAMCLALLATVSRGSLVGLAAGLGLIGLVRDRRLLAAILVTGLLVVALAGVLPWTERYVAHFTAGLAREDLATQMRMGEYQDAWRLIQRYPVIGVGFGGVRDIDLYRGVSSLYLIVAETMGLVGLGVFLWALGRISGAIAAAWRSMPADGVRAIALGTVAAFAAALVSGIFDHYFFTYPHAFALLWLLAALGVAAVRVASTENGAILAVTPKPELHARE